MNRGLLSALREQHTPPLDAAGKTGTLNEDQHRTVFVLFADLSGDDDVPKSAVRTFVDGRTREVAGLLDEYSAGAALLDEHAARARPGARFHELAGAERHRVLGRILHPYPHPVNEPAWRRRASLISDNIELLFGDRRLRAFRVHVVRDLLTHYYTTDRGWSVVDYREYPGRVRAEAESCEVRAVVMDGDDLLLELSDGCFEKLDPAALVPDEKTELAVLTKAGRQRAVFSRAAYFALAEHLESTEDGFVLRIAERTYEVLR